MDEIDPLVAALIRLCEKEGGFKQVADRAKVSPDNLWQIVNSIKLPSGNPRGVGPRLREKLSSAYPEWLVSGSPRGGTSTESLIDTLQDWRLQASSKSQEVIDQLTLLAKKNMLGDEDWLLIEQLLHRMVRK